MVQPLVQTKRWDAAADDNVVQGPLASNVLCAGNPSGAIEAHQFNGSGWVVADSYPIFGWTGWTPKNTAANAAGMVAATYLVGGDALASVTFASGALTVNELVAGGGSLGSYIRPVLSEDGEAYVYKAASTSPVVALSMADGSVLWSVTSTGGFVAAPAGDRSIWIGVVDDTIKLLDGLGDTVATLVDDHSSQLNVSWLTADGYFPWGTETSYERWIGLGDGLTARVTCAAPSLEPPLTSATYRVLDASGDALAWLTAETALAVDEPLANDLLASCWDGQLALTPALTVPSGS